MDFGLQELFGSCWDAEFVVENTAFTRGWDEPWEIHMNLKTLTTDLTNDMGRLNSSLMVDSEGGFTHIVDPDHCGWIVRHHFNGLIGVVYAFVVLCLLGAIVGFALYARQ